jgi:hypothetical protein
MTRQADHCGLQILIPDQTAHARAVARLTGVNYPAWFLFVQSMYA